MLTGCNKKSSAIIFRPSTLTSYISAAPLSCRDVKYLFNSLNKKKIAIYLVKSIATFLILDCELCFTEYTLAVHIRACRTEAHSLFCKRSVEALNYSLSRVIRGHGNGWKYDRNLQVSGWREHNTVHTFYISGFLVQTKFPSKIREGILDDFQVFSGS